MSVRSNQCDRQRIEAFLDERLDQSQQSEFEHHLSECPSCREALDQDTANHELWDKAGSYLQDDEAELQPLSSLGSSSAFGEGRTNFEVEQVLQSLAPTDDPQMLGRIDGYEISGVIGCGGMGAVLKGYDRPLKRVVAIKVMAPHLASSTAARKRFAREAQAAAAMTHDNVIDIYGVAESNSLPYLVMPYAAGTSLQARLDQRGRLPVVEVLRIGSQIAAGLAAAHQQGIVHRDIKPANILLNDGIERLVITDFGLARAVDDASVTRTGVIAGTPQYMSPEQARGDAIDFRSDLFSLGSILYTACTGQLPFEADSAYGILRRITDVEPRSIRDINPQIPEWLCTVIRKLLHKSVEGRYRTAEDVHHVLQGCLLHLQSPSEPLPADLRSPRRPHRKRLMLGAAGAMLCAVIWIVVAGRLKPDSNLHQPAANSKLNSETNQSAATITGSAALTDQVRAERQTAASQAAETETAWDGIAPLPANLYREAKQLADESQSPFSDPE